MNTDIVWYASLRAAIDRGPSVDVTIFAATSRAALSPTGDLTPWDREVFCHSEATGRSVGTAHPREEDCPGKRAARRPELREHAWSHARSIARPWGSRAASTRPAADPTRGANACARSRPTARIQQDWAASSYARPDDNASETGTPLAVQ